MRGEFIRCRGDGVFIWPGVPLIEKRGVRFERVSERDVANRAGVLFGRDVLYGPGNGSEKDPEYGQIQKCGDRGFLDPTAISASDDNSDDENKA